MKFSKVFIISAFFLSFSSVSAANVGTDPIVAEPQFAKTSLQPKETTEITVEASSPLDLPLTFIWNAVSGEITGEGTRAIFTAPKTVPLTGFDTIIVSVRDSEGNVTTRANLIPITAANVSSILSFDPETKTGYIGQSTSIKIWMDTGQESIDTAELKIKFNPLLVKVDQIIALPLFSEISNQKIQDDTVSFTLHGDSFQGSGAIAEIHFTPLSLGQAEFSFDFTPDELSDSNLFLLEKSGTDLLSDVVSGFVNISDSQEVEYRYVYEYVDKESTPTPTKNPEVGPGLWITLFLTATVSGITFLLQKQQQV